MSTMQGEPEAVEFLVDLMERHRARTLGDLIARGIVTEEEAENALPVPDGLILDLVDGSHLLVTIRLKLTRVRARPDGGFEPASLWKRLWRKWHGLAL